MLRVNAREKTDILHHGLFIIWENVSTKCYYHRLSVGETFSTWKDAFLISLAISLKFKREICNILITSDQKYDFSSVMMESLYISYILYLMELVFSIFIIDFVIHFYSCNQYSYIILYHVQYSLFFIQCSLFIFNILYSQLFILFILKFLLFLYSKIFIFLYSKTVLLGVIEYIKGSPWWSSIIISKMNALWITILQSYITSIFLSILFFFYYCFVYYAYYYYYFLLFYYA